MSRHLLTTRNVVLSSSWLVHPRSWRRRRVTGEERPGVAAPPSWEEGRGEDPLVRAANEVAADQDPVTLERAGVHNNVITGGGGGGGGGRKN